MTKMKLNETIDEVFAQALELEDPVERDRYLESVCLGNDTVLSEVKRMLCLLPLVGSFIESPPNLSTFIEKSEIFAPAIDLTGQSIGPFRVISLIARGGMGRVYLAEQETPIRRRVAIKVIRSELANDEILTRFELERDVLGLMDHPNIARVLDAGTTSSGESFFAMEWVDGDSITEFCQRESLTIRQRVELLLTICQAVHHAHQKGIIHRDLKPSNVLVTLRDGKHVPKIIDFGIARATADAMLNRDQMTEAGQIMGTFDYMAPEQADQCNLDIDTRADVYSLGALTYELLTHSPPLASKIPTPCSLTERLKIIKECVPEKPSQRLNSSSAKPENAQPVQPHARANSALIEQDLDWIVLKCLEKDRARRYETVVALAQDLERHLNGQPVLACPPTLRYRLSKFAKKYRTALALGTTFSLLLLCASVVSIVQAVRANRLHRQSQANLADAQENLRLAIAAVDSFGTRVSEDLRLNKEDLRPLRKGLLSTAVDFHEQLLERRGTSGLARLDLAQAYRRLAELSKEIDTPGQAVDYYHLAIGEFEKLSEGQQNDLSVQLDVANCCQNLAHLLLHNGELTLARESAKRAASIYSQMPTGVACSSESRIALTKTRMLQSAIEYAFNNIDQANAFVLEAIGGWHEILEDEPNAPEWLAQLAYSHKRYSMHLLSMSYSKWREAENELKTANELARRAIEFPNTSDYCRQVLAESLLDLGNIAKITNRYDVAIERLTEAASMFEASRASEPSVWHHAHSLARCYLQIASVYDLQKSKEEVGQYLIRARELLGPLVDADIDNAAAAVTLAEVLSSLGEMSVDEGAPEAGLELFNEAIRLNDVRLVRDPESRVRTEAAPFMWRERGQVLEQLGRFDEALRDYDLAIQNANPGFRERLRMERSGLLIKTGEYRRVLQENREILSVLQQSKDSHTLPYQYVRCAKLYASCGARILADSAIDPSEQASISKECFSEAIELLQKVRESGIDDFESLQAEEEFEPLRNRDDFEQLFR